MHARLKTSRGRFPVEGASLRNNSDGLAEVAFDFPDSPDAENAAAAGTRFDVESLACTLPQTPVVDESLLLERIMQAARLTGPLFGQPQAESILDWVCEIRIAQIALALQQAVNGNTDLAVPSNHVVKSQVSAASAQRAAVFTSYCLSLSLGQAGKGQLEQVFPAMPWMKRFADDGLRDYAFARVDTVEGQRIMDLHLVSFPQEIDATDYLVMTSYFQQQGYDIAQATQANPDLQELAGLEAQAQASQLALVDAVSREAPLQEEDIPHLQRLVHALVSLHTEGVHVDLFKSDGSHDFLAFDTYVSSIWYSFAMRLGTVKMGYCIQCGRGFSTTGHRGIAKEYCSEACRTQAKNERRRAHTTTIRKLFMDGADVAHIAARVYPEAGTRAGQNQVRTALRRWPELKQAVARDIQQGDGAFTKRCLAEGAIEESFVARKAKAAAKARSQGSSPRQPGAAASPEH